MLCATQHTLRLLKYHREHPEVRNQRLSERFGVSRQWVSRIIKRYERDRIALQHFRTHPGTSPDDMEAMFGIRSISRLRTLMLEDLYLP